MMDGEEMIRRAADRKKRSDEQTKNAGCAIAALTITLALICSGTSIVIAWLMR